MTITNVKEYDILPSRWDYFERRMEKLKEAAGRKIPPIDFNYSSKPATTKPLDPIFDSKSHAWFSSRCSAIAEWELGS